MNLNDFSKFLELSEDKRFEYLIKELTGTKLYLWQKLYIKHINKWWTHMKESNPHLEPYILWESICKGRF